MRPVDLIVNVLDDSDAQNHKWAYLKLSPRAKLRVITIEPGESLDYIKKNLPKVIPNRYPTSIIVASPIPVPKGNVVLEITESRQGILGLSYSHQMIEPEEQLSGSTEEYPTDLIAKIGELTVSNLRLHKRANILEEQKRDIQAQIRAIDKSIEDLYRQLED